MVRSAGPCLILCVALAGCNARKEGTPSVGDAQKPPTIADPWKIEATPGQLPALLWNGKLGVRVGPRGDGEGADGKPLPAFTASSYGGGGEEKIVPVDNPLQKLPGEPQSQTLDLQTGWIVTKLKDGHTVYTAIDSRMERAEATVDKPGLLAVMASADWEARWRTDIEIDGPVEDQQALRAMMFYLRSSIHPEGTMSVAPFGLADAKYNGHVFWDADIWVFPALAFMEPLRASRIPAYRLARMDAYKENSGGVGLKVPWESSVSGRETAPEAMRRELHVTGSVAYALKGASALGLADPKKVQEFIQGAGAYYAAQATKGQEGQELRDVVSPDENFRGANDLYTNLLAQWSENQGSFEGAAKFKLPHDSQSFLTYDNDPVRSYKQAAAALAIYPLQYPPAEKEAKTMMERFSAKVIKNGPAMSDSVHALIWARLGEPDRGYDIWKRSWQEFMKPPFLLFGEKRTLGTTYFTTGAGGCLQTVLYGFLGFRIDSQQDRSAKWSTPLKEGKWLNITPHLPKSWKSATFKRAWILGKRYTIKVTPQGVDVSGG